MQPFPCKTSSAHFISITSRTLCMAPSESITEMPRIPLNSGSGRAKPGTKHGIQLLLQLLEKPGQVPAEVFRGLFIPEAPTSARLFCRSDQGVPVLAVLWSPHGCPQDPSTHPALPLPFPPPPVSSGDADFGTAVPSPVSLTPGLMVGVGSGKMFSWFSFSVPQAGN